MSVYKVDICGVTTSKLPVLKDDEKEEAQGDERNHGRNLVLI